MKRTITLKGIQFEEKKPVSMAEHVIVRRDLMECYKKPSNIKMIIWNDWCEWFHKFEVYNYTVASYNCNFFTIEGEIYYGGEWFFIRITPCHNYISRQI